MAILGIVANEIKNLYCTQIEELEEEQNFSCPKSARGRMWAYLGRHKIINFEQILVFCAPTYAHGQTWALMGRLGQTGFSVKNTQWVTYKPRLILDD
ncbi:hypothetical protein [Nostoc sp. PA-18-2419]|uniref:hypothetical protein n=1 Tax=Nostoc sp. PA-18-2419 TaxID=2575443 RepID=UPI001672E978|nr:hypothetical protein [Nostoc sp. PA-18-2419]